jgi:hypothetical protein
MDTRNCFFVIPAEVEVGFWKIFEVFALLDKRERDTRVVKSCIWMLIGLSNIDSMDFIQEYFVKLLLQTN